MKRFNTIQVPDDSKNAVAAIGNFDGVHLGHQAVLDQARSIADQSNAPLAVITFEPHPRSYFAKTGTAPFGLMNADARAHRLDKLGVDIVYELPFDSHLATLTPDDFAQQVLGHGLGLRHAIVGADFCYGQGRRGNATSLSQQGEKYGFGVSVAQLMDIGDVVISSSNIRQALTDANPRRAAAMLGHWHRIENSVIKGDQRGRELGFPTANISIDGLHPPAFGIYAVIVDVLTGPHRGAYRGASSIGVNPTFGENTPNCEIYLFDFDGDLYGETLSVGLVEYLRGEEKFETLATLITQIGNDCDKARAILAAL